MKKIMFLLGVVMAGSFGLFAMQCGPGAARVPFDAGSEAGDDAGYDAARGDDEDDSSYNSSDYAESMIDDYDALSDDLRRALEDEPMSITDIKRKLKEIFDREGTADLGAKVQSVIGGYLSADSVYNFNQHDYGRIPLISLNAMALRNALDWAYTREFLPDGFAQEFVTQSSVLLSGEADVLSMIKILDLLPRVAPFLFKTLSSNEVSMLLCAASAANYADGRPYSVREYYVKFLKDGLTSGYLDAAKEKALSLYLAEFIKCFPISTSDSLRERSAFLKPVCIALTRWSAERGTRELLRRALGFICLHMANFAGKYESFFNLLKLIAFNAPRVLADKDLKECLGSYIKKTDEDAPLTHELMDFAKAHKIVRHHRHSRGM